jgi:NAD(P)-dependent dehydrogenase (short-subunit alcohol dehydrogenase family)
MIAQLAVKCLILLHVGPMPDRAYVHGMSEWAGVRPNTPNTMTLFPALKRPCLRQSKGEGAGKMSLKDKSIVVTGGSRGLGLGLVEALVHHGAKVTVVARDQRALAAVAQRLGVAVVSADIAGDGVAQRVLAEVRPDVLVLNAGATPPMDRLDRVSWADFTATWDTDVKAGLYWMQAALNLPLKPGSRILVGSSGAAVNGSPMSGGYAGAKRMLWIMTKYANGVSAEKRLGICFQAIVPMQIIGGTGVGDAGAKAYAGAAGMAPEQFLARFGAPLPPREFGEKTVSILNDPKYAEAVAFGLKGDTGITVLEGAAT